MGRFEKQKNIHDEFWTVIDSVTARPATVDELPMDALTEDEADEMIVLLEANHIQTDERPT
ncbi:hypothetical protein G6L37_31850 [Agrobacterium rubi]|uniref:hypothetical protein n=1 Tax=Agrobacterium rubi TaxID=28099 RepID=UPI0015724718|nr:hypothetical protein [Agrobacterium rubi]NTF10595.1 hypothetical protein [Agrobacterium rubi]NTF22989.1 hypothetical protein [Agrobacterium rubi]NTF29920.1 hypothetical protein [Agrobacterium rubi]